MIEISEILRDNITKDELIPAASLVLTVGVILAGGYVMSYLVKIEEENVQKTLGAKGLKVTNYDWLIDWCVLIYICSIFCYQLCPIIKL